MWDNSYQTCLEEEKLLEKSFKLLQKGILPNSFKGYRLNPYPMLMHNIEHYTNWRDKYIKNFGFPLFSEDWVKPLAKWIGDRPCLEIMAGTGFFSHVLKQYGVNICATDNYSWSKQFNNFIDVEKLDCLEAIKKYGKDIKFIICSWPYMDSMAYKSLMLMREINPRCRMIYVGESWGGCTASDKFFDNAEECEVIGFKQAVSKYCCWSGIHDRINLYK